VQFETYSLGQGKNQMSNKLDISETKIFINRMMKQWKVPGLAILIIKDGRIVLQEGFGYRNIKKNLKVTPDTVFAIASCTKAFTTLAMSILVDEKKLEWNKPVRDYLPEFKLFDPVATERMTPCDLVTHRSGLPRHDAIWYKSSETRKELFQRLPNLEPNKDFRSLYQYNNLMFMAAGCVVEEISGMSWEKFVSKRILQPLQMNHTNFSVIDSQKSSDYALGYEIKNKTLRMAPFVNIDALGPAGSMNSTISDMTKWVLFQLNQGKIGKKKLISLEQLGEMHSPQMTIKEPVSYNETQHRNYGMGWVIRLYRGHKIVYHTGSMDGFSSYASFLPQENMGIAILTNLDSTSLPFVIAYSLFDKMLGFKKVNWIQRIKKEDKNEKKETTDKKIKFAKDRKKGTRLSHPIQEYIGEFENRGYGIVTVKQKKKNLVMRYNMRTFQAGHYHFDTFLLKESREDVGRVAMYQMNPQGQPDTLSISFDPTIKEIVFIRKR
jgi:CubicO group peptidase (beta-lactamase class C family)